MAESARLLNGYTPKGYRGFESHPLRHFNGPAKHAGWGENPFGEPRGEQAMPIGIGPSGPERSGANPILSATFITQPSWPGGMIIGLIYRSACLEPEDHIRSLAILAELLGVLR